MQDTIVTIYCLCDDLLKAMNHQDNQQTRFSSADSLFCRRSHVRAYHCLCLLWRQHGSHPRLFA
jgi:hypothetical protein